MSLDRYAKAAEEHMRIYLPARYRQIRDPDSYFRGVGDQIAAQVAELEARLAAAQPVSTDYLTRVGQLSSARSRAEEIVFADLVYLPPEHPDPEGLTVWADRTGADFGWSDQTAQSIGAPGPIWEDWQEERWHRGQDPETGEPLLTDREIEATANRQATRRAEATSPPLAPD